MDFIVLTASQTFKLKAEKLEVFEDSSLVLFRNESDELLLTLPREEFKYCERVYYGEGK